MDSQAWWRTQLEAFAHCLRLRALDGTAQHRTPSHATCPDPSHSQSCGLVDAASCTGAACRQCHSPAAGSNAA